MNPLRSLEGEDWAEIRRLRRAEAMPIKVIARSLGISMNTAFAEHAGGREGAPAVRAGSPREQRLDRAIIGAFRSAGSRCVWPALRALPLHAWTSEPARTGRPLAVVMEVECDR